MRLRRAQAVRRGASMVEGAIIFLVLFSLVQGTLDLGIGVLRYHLVSEAARQGARQAIVHGTLAPPQMQTWGPSTINSPATAGNVPLVAAVQPYLVGFDLSKTTVTGVWIDGSTDAGKRVQVTVSTPYQPVMTFIFGNPTYNLSATSTMPIAH